MSEIARRTSLTRNTLKKWLKEPGRDAMRYERPGGPCKLDAQAEWFRQALETDARRPRKERRTALRLFAQLKERGYAGGYSQVTAFIRAWRAEAGAVTARSAYVPLRFDWGEAFQFDWSEEHLVIGGIWRKVQLAHMKLCASRAFWLVAYPSQSHEMLFDAHTRCLTGLGGVARRGIYDNMTDSGTCEMEASSCSQLRRPEHALQSGLFLRPNDTGDMSSYRLFPLAWPCCEKKISIRVGGQAANHENGGGVRSTVHESVCVCF